MSMNWKDAQKWAREVEYPQTRDWRDMWKYGKVVRRISLGDGVTIYFGEEATQEQKEMLKDCIQSPNKWASVVEDLLDNPPDKDERKILKCMKRTKK